MTQVDSDIYMTYIYTYMYIPVYTIKKATKKDILKNKSKRNFKISSSDPQESK